MYAFKYSGSVVVTPSIKDVFSFEFVSLRLIERIITFRPVVVLILFFVSVDRDYGLVLVT